MKTRNNLLLNFADPDKETNKNTNFCWEEPEAKQGSQEEIEAFLIGQKAKNYCLVTKMLGCCDGLK